mmetsp:Transcript_11978/g.37289  ORF Transcript_11978/g.37289 Transcript_11978/m.37289 type:complete len:240 (+) Transcript_11978:1068-1787(+)
MQGSFFLNRGAQEKNHTVHSRHFRCDPLLQVVMQMQPHRTGPFNPPSQQRCQHAAQLGDPMRGCLRLACQQRQTKFRYCCDVWRRSGFRSCLRTFPFARRRCGGLRRSGQLFEHRARVCDGFLDNGRNVLFWGLRFLRRRCRRCCAFFGRRFAFGVLRALFPLADRRRLVRGVGSLRYDDEVDQRFRILRRHRLSFDPPVVDRSHLAHDLQTVDFQLHQSGSQEAHRVVPVVQERARSE